MIKEIFELVVLYLGRIWNSSAADWIRSIVGGLIAAYIVPVQAYILLALVLCIVDQFTGVRAARLRGEQIVSKKLRRTFEKVLVYVLALGVVHGFEQVVLINFIGSSKPLTWLVIFTISVHELQSILENVGAITGVNLWRVVKDKIGSIINNDKKK